MDFWISDYRHFVYPHLCNGANPPTQYYDDDDEIVYNIENDPSAYYDFRTEIYNAIYHQFIAHCFLKNCGIPCD